MLYAVLTSGPMVEHINSRLTMIGVGPVGLSPPTGYTHDDGRRQITNDLFRERSGTLWNFTFGGKVPELYGTL